MAASTAASKLTGLMKNRFFKKAVLCGNHVWKHWLRPMAVSAAFILPVKSSLADLNWVPTGSMKPTILEGDLIYVNKLAYDLKIPFTQMHLAEWSEPRKGDIVVLFSPEDGTRLVKRIVAEPGDTIAMKGDVILLNGEPLSYKAADTSRFREEIHESSCPVFARESLGGDEHWVMALPDRAAMRDFPATTLSAGNYFVMGDSRDNSKDSRFIGLIQRKQIVGKAERAVASANLNRHCLPRFDRFFSKLDG